MNILVKILILSFSLTLSANAWAGEISLKKIKGNKTITNKNWKKKLTVVQFWASWCEGCSENMMKVSQLNKVKNNDVEFLPVSVDETFGEAKSYVNELPKKYRSIKKASFFDKGTQFAESADVGSLPATVVFDENRKIVSKIEGKLNRKQLKKLKRILKKN